MNDVTDVRARPELILVVPVFNEALRIDADLFRGFLQGDISTALYFVDDGSSDGTRALLEQLQLTMTAQIQVFHLPQNRGKAEAVRYGLERALAGTARYAGFIDADLSAPLEAVPLLRADLDAHPEAWAAIGSRIKLLGRSIERSERRHYLGRIFATFASLALAIPVYDTQCGLKLFRDVPDVRAAVATPFTSRWIFDVELLARLVQRAGSTIVLRVREVPLERWEEHGSSRLRLRDYVRAPLELFRIWRTYRRRS